MQAQFVEAVVVEPLHSCGLDRPVHSFDLAVRPGVVRFGRSVIDTVCPADYGEAHWPRIDCVPVPRLLCELHAFIRQNRVDLVGRSFKHLLEEIQSCLFVGRINQLDHSERGRADDAN